MDMLEREAAAAGLMPRVKYSSTGVCRPLWVLRLACELARCRKLMAEYSIRSEVSRLCAKHLHVKDDKKAQSLRASHSKSNPGERKESRAAESVLSSPI